jgi:hypothetical protein
MLLNLWHLIENRLPLVLLALVLWWFIREEPEDAPSGEDDGGQRVEPLSAQHPRRPRPGGRGPRPRGPHGEPAPAAPDRVRLARTPRRQRVR